MQRYPKTTWAEQSKLHIARTARLAGRWREAAAAFDLYATHWGATAREKKEADRYRALVHLMAGDRKIARRLLEDWRAARIFIGQARWINLAALAALRDGDRLPRVSRWSEVARTRPLSWPALVARARLQWQNAPLPPVIEPSEAGSEPPPLDVSLPPPVDMLHRIGLDGDAEEALRERETAVAARAPGRGTEALCRAYAALDRGKRRLPALARRAWAAPHHGAWSEESLGVGLRLPAPARSASDNGGGRDETPDLAPLGGHAPGECVRSGGRVTSACGRFAAAHA